jgi:hypothetical protein
MPKILSPDTLPTTRPDGPGYYRRDFDGQPIAWRSWWNPDWPHPVQPDGSSRSPQDQQQLLSPHEEDSFAWELGVVHGVRVLGAREEQNRGYRLTLADRFRRNQEPTDPLAGDPRALQMLVDALEKWGVLLRDRLSALPCRVAHDDPESAERAAREMPDFAGPPYSLGESGLPGEADDVLAAMLEHVGPKGRELAASVRKGSAERLQQQGAGEISLAEAWLPWLPNPAEGGRVRRHEALVAALWHDVVCPSLRKPLALTRAIYAPVVGLLAKREMQHDASTGERTLTSGSAVLARVVNIDASALRYFDTGLELFDSIHAHRILFHLASEGHRRALDASVLDPRALRYPGGYGALAEACGIRGDKGTAQVRAIVEAMSTLDIPLAPGRWAHLFSRDFTEAKGRRQAHLAIVLGTPLLPDYVGELRAAVGEHGVAAQRTRDLIPLLPVPPVIGRPNEQGRQATLAMRVVAELRDHAPDLARQWGAPLPPSRFKELAEASHLPVAMAPRVLEHWLQDHGAGGPAFLKMVDTDRYTLGDAHLAERQFLEASGQLTLDSRAAGRQSADKRARARRRAGGR